MKKKIAFVYYDLSVGGLPRALKGVSKFTESTRNPFITRDVFYDAKTTAVFTLLDESVIEVVPVSEGLDFSTYDEVYVDYMIEKTIDLNKFSKVIVGTFDEGGVS